MTPPISDWGDEYPYTFALEHGPVRHVYRYRTFAEYIADLLEFMAKPHAEVVIRVTEPAPQIR